MSGHFKRKDYKKIVPELPLGIKIGI